MRLFAPSEVPSFKVTRLSRTQPGPKTTPDSMMEKGPTWTSGLILAEGLMIAEG
jgi:hypothetical protein